MLYHLGCCRIKLNSFATALALYTQALELVERSPVPADRLRSHILEWRSRCYRQARDYQAAKEDVERALELAEGLNDRHTMAHVYFQYSLIAERTGNWVQARSYAEKAKAIYEEVRDEANVGKLLNEMGALNHQLGRSDEAIGYLKQSFKVLLDLGDDTNAARVINSLARVNLATGQIELAESQAREALAMLGDRVDHLDEIGNAQLVLGSSLLEQGRYEEAAEYFAAAESSFDQHFRRQPTCRRLDGPGRSCGAAGRRPPGRAAVPPRSGNAPGLPLLEGGDDCEGEGSPDADHVGRVPRTAGRVRPFRRPLARRHARYQGRDPRRAGRSPARIAPLRF